MMQYLKDLWITFALRRKMDTLDRQALRLSKQVEASNLRLENHIQEIKELQSLIEDEATAARKEALRAKELNRQLEATLVAAREEIKNLKGIVIPGLVSANMTFQQAWDAQTARFAMQGAAAAELKEEQ